MKNHSLSLNTYVSRCREKLLTLYEWTIDYRYAHPKKFWMWVSGCGLVISSLIIMIITIPASPDQHGAGAELNLEDLFAGTDLAVAKQKKITCLQNKGVAFYGGARCGYSCEDVQKYGNDMKNFPCVDCDHHPDQCQGMDITHLPVRKNSGGLEARDIMSLDQLADEYGCNQ